MTAKPRSWWEQIQKYWKAIGVVAIVLIVVVVIGLIVAVVVSNGTGFNGYNKVSTVHTISGPSAGTVTKTEEYQPGKTLWDLLQLLAALAIPVVVGFGAAWFTAHQGKVSARENIDNQREKALQDYIDKISDLLLKEHPGWLTLEGESNPEYEGIRKIARVRTLTVLRRLDGDRKRSLLLFLYESGLLGSITIDKYKPFIYLSGADLRNADLSKADLSGADLSHTKLEENNLSNANLNGTLLYGADLRGANMREAFLPDAVLQDALLQGANMQGAFLRGAALHAAHLEDANLEDANLEDAMLLAARLNRADLRNANLSGADLRNADLSGVNLIEAQNLTQQQLDQVYTCKDAILPKGLTCHKQPQIP